MVKTTTLLTENEKQDKNATELESNAGALQSLEPSESTILTILNYSKSLEVKHSKEIGALKNTLN